MHCHRHPNVTITFRYFLFLLLMTTSNSCAAEKRTADSYIDYSPKEASFLLDAEHLLFGTAKSIYPQGGDLAMKHAVQIDGICYSLFVNLKGNAAFAKTFNPRNFWTDESGVGSRECDQNAFFEDIQYDRPFQPTTHPEVAINGAVKLVIKRRSRLFLQVSDKRDVPSEWLEHRLNIGYFKENPECAAYVKRDSFGSYNILLTFLRKRGNESVASAVKSRASRRKVLIELVRNKTFGQCVVRTLALARGLEGASVAPDSFFVTQDSLVFEEYFPDGCAVDDGWKEPHYPGNELTCGVPRRKAGYLSGWILWALDSTDPKSKVFSRLDFRAWIRKWIPPGHPLLAKQIEAMESIH